MRKMIALVISTAVLLGTTGLAVAQTSTTTPAPAATPPATAPAPKTGPAMKMSAEEKAKKAMAGLDEKKAACLQKAGSDEAKKAACEKQYAASKAKMEKKPAMPEKK